MSKRGGYRSNAVHRWERGLAWPTAARFLQLCDRLGASPAVAFRTFYRSAPSWLDRTEPSSRAAVAAFLEELRGKTPIVEIASHTGFDRSTLGRWLRGTAEPRLPEFLRLIDALSRRVLDFVAAFVDPAALPSAARAWKQIVAAREAAYGSPWSQAVLRALELDDYQRRGFAQPGWLAAKVGLTEDEVQRSLVVLRESGQARRRGQRWTPTRLPKVDTRQDPERARALRVAWTRAAVRRMEQGTPGSYGFSLFAVSASGLRELRDLHLEYVRAMQSVISRSRSNDCVGLYCAQLLDLDASDRNVLATR